ncbi:MAG: hypothetical protein MZV49_09340 [Rhodopseudomonas palustris]|nr:hypothetical protein [Rhodopseudomonas palustris]
MSKLCASADKPLALQQCRVEKGFSVDIAKHYKDFFTEEAFKKYITPYSYVNLNNDDEFAIEKAIMEAGGDNSFATQVRNSIRQKREAMELLSQEELESLLAPQKEKLADIISIVPQWNVNHVDALLLTGLVSYEPFKIKNASTIAASILATRQYRPLTQKQLVDLTGPDAKHRLFTWLGARSWFWSVTISGSKTTLHAVLARALPHSGDTAGINESFSGRMEGGEKMSAGKRRQPSFFTLTPGVLYFTGQSYIVRYLPNPGLPPEALEDYVNTKLSKLYPAQHQELKCDCEIVGDQIKLIVIKNKILNDGLEQAPGAYPVSAVKGFVNSEGRYRRIVIFEDVLDISVFENGMLAEKETTNRSALQVLLGNSTDKTQILADKQELQKLAELAPQVNVELVSFQDTFALAKTVYAL